MYKLAGDRRPCVWVRKHRGDEGRVKVGTLQKLGGGVMGGSLSNGTVFYLIKIFQC